MVTGTRSGSLFGGDDPSRETEQRRQEEEEQKFVPTITAQEVETLVTGLQQFGYVVPKAGELTTGPAQATVTPFFASSGLKFPSPAHYSGDPDLLDGFVDQMTMFLEANGIDPNTHRAVCVAALHFRGQAQEWFAGVSRALRLKQMAPLTSWSDLVSLLTEWIRPVESMMLHYETFFNMQQGKHQSVKEYITAYNTARMRVSVPPICDPVLCYAFLRGLKPHLRTHVQSRDPKTLADYIRIANTIVDLQASVPGKSGKDASPSSSNGSKLHCTFCKKSGHDVTMCFKKHPELRPSEKKVRFSPKDKDKN